MPFLREDLSSGHCNRAQTLVYHFNHISPYRIFQKLTTNCKICNLSPKHGCLVCEPKNEESRGARWRDTEPWDSVMVFYVPSLKTKHKILNFHVCCIYNTYQTKPKPLLLLECKAASSSSTCSSCTQSLQPSNGFISLDPNIPTVVRCYTFNIP